VQSVETYGSSINVQLLFVKFASEGMGTSIILIVGNEKLVEDDEPSSSLSSALGCSSSNIVLLHSQTGGGFAITSQLTVNCPPKTGVEPRRNRNLFLGLSADEQLP